MKNVMMTGLMMTLVVLGAAGSGIADEVDRLRGEVKKLKARTVEQQAMIEALTKQVEALQAQNLQLRTQLVQTQEAKAEIADDLAESQSRVQTLEVETEKLAATAERALPEVVQTTYDEADDTTTLRVPEQRLDITHGSTATTIFTLTHQFSGQSSERADGLITMQVEANASGGIYRSADDAALRIGDQTHRVALNDYQIARKTSGGRKKVRYDNESFSLKIPMDLVRKMAGTREVTGNIGPVRFKLDAADVQALREMLQKAGG